MTCRHSKNDLNCSNNPKNREYLERVGAARELVNNPPTTPDKSNYYIEEMERFGNHIVLRVRYPNCRDCSFEGNKTMVFLNVTEKQIIHWKTIDPHFRDPKKAIMKTEAPSPAARFPGNSEGWKDACDYARSKGIK